MLIASSKYESFPGLRPVGVTLCNVGTLTSILADCGKCCGMNDGLRDKARHLTSTQKWLFGSICAHTVFLLSYVQSDRNSVHVCRKTWKKKDQLFDTDGSSGFVQSLWLERTTLTLVQSLPGISRWFEVEKKELVSVSVFKITKAAFC